MLRDLPTLALSFASHGLNSSVLYMLDEKCDGPKEMAVVKSFSVLTSNLFLGSAVERN